MMLELRVKNSASRLWLGFGLLALLFSVVIGAHAQTRPQSPVPVPVPFNPIVDNANVIDADTRRRLESIYLNLKERGQIEYAVVTVPTMGEQDIYDFSLAVARGWGIGPKDGDKASFLIVVAIQDRKYFTQVSRHIEGDLPDGLVGQIQRERLVPAFRQGNYSKGIFDTVQAYVATLGQKRGFTVDGIDQRYAYRAEQPTTDVRTSRKSVGLTCCGVIAIVFVLMLLSAGSRGGRGGRGGRRGGGGGGLLSALLWGSLINSMSGGSRGWGSSSGWGGGGFGGSGGGGGGGGFGGGFGGGGDFGGGGAGGSW